MEDLLTGYPNYLKDIWLRKHVRFSINKIAKILFRCCWGNMDTFKLDKQLIVLEDIVTYPVIIIWLY